MKKEIKEELENVNGAGADGDMCIKCDNCGKLYTASSSSGTRQIEDGCDSYNEYKCPDCGAWKKEK